MKPSQIALGLWNHLEGEDSGAELLQVALESGVRTFITSDTLGGGKADRLLGEAIRNSIVPREELCIIGSIGYVAGKSGHGYSSAKARFTGTRDESEFGEYVESTVKSSLEALGIDSFDVLLLQDPDLAGFRSTAAWDALAKAKDDGHAISLGLAPGPANGYALDLLRAFDQFGDLLDYAMIVYNPIEPWPGELCLTAASEAGIDLIVRESVVPGGPNAPAEKEKRQAKRTAIREISESRITSQGVATLEELWVAWSLDNPAVKSVVPPLPGPDNAPLKDRLERLASLETLDATELSTDFDQVRETGSNRGMVALKGGTQHFQGKVQTEQWPLDVELEKTAEKHGIVLDRDYLFKGDPRDHRDFGMPKRGVPQAIDRRLFMQLQVFSGVDRDAAVDAMKSAKTPGVAYADLNDPRGIGVLLWDEDPLALSQQASETYSSEAFANASLRPEFTMLGRTYAFGREDDVTYWLTQRPIDSATFPDRPWAVWYPLRRKPEFYRLPRAEQAEMLREHGIIGHHYGSSGYATDIRLECFGMDANDNEFVLGLLSDRLYWLSRLVKDMRGTKQTGEFMNSLGPFFVGHTIYQSAG
ncbi:MAG: chlorite dismutase family protein [Verrucomicrobiota bacterium]